MSSPNLPLHPTPRSTSPDDVRGLHALPATDAREDLDAAQLAERIDWRRLLAALVRYKWLVLAVTILGTLAGLWSTRLVHPQYLAQGTVWIEGPETRSLSRDRGPLRTEQLVQPVAWVDLLKSYHVLEHVVQDMRLYLQLDPEDSLALRGLRVRDGFRPGDYRLLVRGDGSYTLSTEDGIELDRGQMGDSVGVGLGLQWAPAKGTVRPGRPVKFTLVTTRDASHSLEERLKVQMDPEGNFLRLELAGSSPRLVTAIVNGIIERFVQVAADLKKQKLTELTGILDGQRERAEKDLRDAELALEQFRAAHITQAGEAPARGGGGGGGNVAGAGGSGNQVEANDPVRDSYFAQQIMRDGLRRDRESLEHWLAAAAGDRAPGTIAALTTVQSSADLSGALHELSEKQTELRKLESKYSEAYPPVQRLRADITGLRESVLPVMVKALISELRDREADLNRRLASAGGELRQIPKRSLEEARLRRAVTLAENLYMTLQQRYGENKIEEASSTPDVRVLDAAVAPMRPFKNSAPRIVLLAFLGSLGLALAVVVLLDRMDPKVRYPEQVSRDLGLTFLGSVPHFATRGAYQLSGDDTAEVIEALRGVCLSLVYAHRAAGPILLTVTSPGPGDGKSFLSANLALTFADAGRRTLLIDGDLRRGVQHRRFPARRRPGLTDYLRGEAPRDAIIHDTPYPLLSIMPCGSRTRSAPELLGMPIMAQLLATLKANYDVIIVDSPPLTGGVDPLIIGAVTGNLMMVLRTGYSHREIAQAKLEVMNRLPIRLLGAVLNDVPSGGQYGYYSYYLPGYVGVDEDKERASPGVV